MATHARQQYFADESSLSKEKREFSIADEVQQKIDSIEEGAQVNTIETIKVNGAEVEPDENKAVDLTIPGVVDSLDSISSTNALSAKQGKVLYDYIQDVSHIGHFLALWNASTGLPVTDPETSPYIYNTGDFYTVSVVAPQGGTNYRPDGTQYVIGQASTTVDTDDVEVNDFYFYDGTTWRHMKNSGAGSIAIDGSLSTTSTNPVENRVITNALNEKQSTLIAGSNIQIAQDGKTISATDTKYTAGTGINIDTNNVINADTSVLATKTELSTKQDKLIPGSNIQIASDGKTISATDTKYTAGTGINIDANNVISNTQTSAEWGNITGTLSDQTDLQTALDAKQDDMVILSYGNSTWNDFITAYQKNGVVYCRASSNSDPSTGSQGRLAFMAYVNNANNPTEVEFQYYRSRNSHSTAANVLDEVYVYKLTNDGTWTVTQRDTAAKPIAGTGIGLTYNASGMTISADTTVLATKTDLNSKQDTISDLAAIRTGAGLGATALQPGDDVSELNNDAGYITNSYHDSTKQDKLIAGDNIQISSSNVISATDTKYEAGTGIGIGTEHSDMQGPAPDGFHVPTYKEWTSLCGILTTTFSLASTDATMKTYLKMPCAGWRGFSDSDVGSQGSNGWYWSSTGINSNSARSLIFGSNYIMAGNISYYAYGHPVRCFKDSPIIPDSSWTVLYDGSSVSTNAGIFYNSTLGLISVSGNGTTWYTIQDKNLGATTVYNDGDTLSEANCGKYYQRGNNYGFPFSGSVTTSSTKVDASNYGPGNYYSSSTFITTSYPYGNWSSVYNYNLWGGVSQGVWVGGDGNTIVNTGVLSVNGQAGKVTIQEGIEYNAGEGIEIKNGPDYSAMQGPAPDGFHVPSKDEWVALCGILTTTLGLSSNATTMGTYLKMPMAGYRYYSDASVDVVGYYGYYWSSTAQDTDTSYYLYFYSSTIEPQSNNRRAYGFSVRGFKDSPTIPTSSRTTLYDGSSVASGAGVFHNATDGLISVSGDGVTWYTIMDKNLGAITVYNQGDTVTDANCGYFYQWGNNYGFPHSGTVTTSATQVDASSYGPGNYYNSSTFITRSVSPSDWSSVQNDNLRGGVTGVITNAITNTGVLSVNGQTGNVTIATGLQVAPNSPITGIKYIWYGTEAQYAALTQYYTEVEGDTEFRCF